MVRKLWLAVAFLGLALSSATAQEGVLSEIYGKGVHAYFANRPWKALEHFNSAIEAGSEDPRAFYFRGLTYLQLGDQWSADSDFQIAADYETKDSNEFYDVSRAIERIQGPQRLKIETYRTQARLEALKRAKQLEYERYERIRRAEPNVTIPPEEAPPVAPAPTQPPAVAPPNPFQEEEVEAPADAEPEMEEPVEEPAEDPAMDEPEEPAVEEPAVEDPAMDEPEEPALDEPAVDEAAEPAALEPDDAVEPLDADAVEPEMEEPVEEALPADEPAVEEEPAPDASTGLPRSRSRVSASRHVELTHLPVEVRTVQPQSFGRGAHVSAGSLDRLFDVLGLKAISRLR